GVEEIEHRRFARYRATALDAGIPVTIALPTRDRFRAESLVPVVVALAAVALGLGFVVALRRQTSDVRRQREADVRRLMSLLRSESRLHRLTQSLQANADHG